MIAQVLTQGTIMALAAWLVGRTVFSRRPAHRYRLFSAALAAMLIIAPMDLIARASDWAFWRIPVPVGLPREVAAGSSPGIPDESGTALGVSTKRTPDGGLANSRNDLPPLKSIGPNAAAASAHYGHAESPVGRSGLASQVRPAAISLNGLLTFAYLLGVVLALVRYALALFRMRCVLRASVPAELGAIKDAADGVRSRLGVRRFPNVLVSETVGTPLAIGGSVCAIVLPANFASRMETEEIVSVLLHEYAHLDQNHSRSVLLSAICKALYWPHPLVHWLAFELVRAREEVSDNYVLNMVSASRFARTLLRAAEARRTQDSYPAAAGLLLPKWSLERRVAGLLDPKRKSETQMTKIKSIALNVSVGALCMSMAGTQLVQAQDSTVIVRQGSKEYVLHATKTQPVTLKVVANGSKRIITYTIVPSRRLRLSSKAAYFRVVRPHAIRVVKMDRPPTRIKTFILADPSSVASDAVRAATVRPDVPQRTLDSTPSAVYRESVSASVPNPAIVADTPPRAPSGAESTTFGIARSAPIIASPDRVSRVLAQDPTAPSQPIESLTITPRATATGAPYQLRVLRTDAVRAGSVNPVSKSKDYSYIVRIDSRDRIASYET